MKAPNRSSLFTRVLGAILWLQLFGPLFAQAADTLSRDGQGALDAPHDSVLSCPAGIKPECVPQRVGTTIVFCKQGDEVQGYTSISDYCLSCHAASRPMAFEHPHHVAYPASRREFREPNSLHDSIVLKAGGLTCKTCHSGADAGNHFLAENYDSTHICGHCHMTGIDCPSREADQQSICFPGSLNGKIRCLTGKEIVLHLSTSEYCSDCHGNMNRFHKVDVAYPVNNRDFTPVADLDPLIKLDNGLVTCESCHEKSGEGMMLCIHCHPK